ncbi:MAG: iron response transcriptional regulator IrrA [Pseudomonadales bacterium]
MQNTKDFEQERDALKAVGLRPTRQRIELLHLLMSQGDRHLTAESLHLETRQAGISVSLATVYNTLNQFTDCGLLVRLAIEPGKTYFDTNNTEHHHFYDENLQALIDVPLEDISCTRLPAAPEGKKIRSVDIVVRIS